MAEWRIAGRLGGGEGRGAWWGQAHRYLLGPKPGRWARMRELSSKFSHPVVRGGVGPGQAGCEIMEAMIMMTDSSRLLVAYLCQELFLVR